MFSWELEVRDAEKWRRPQILAHRNDAAMVNGHRDVGVGHAGAGTAKGFTDAE